MPKKVKVQISKMRADARISGEVRRLDDLAAAESRRLHDIHRLSRKADRRAIEAERARIDAVQLAESRRIDANRAADVAAVGLAATRAELTATNLQEKATDSAAALAAQVEATAKAAAVSVEATAKTLGERIAPLEQARYESAGSKEQRVESKQSYQWTTERILTLLGLVAGGLYFIASQMGARGA